MESSTQLPSPALSRTIALWLLSIVLGTVFIILYTLIALERPTNGKPWLPAGPLLLFSALAAIFSLLAFVLLPVTASIRWAISSGRSFQRHGRLLSVIGGLFGAAAVTAYCFFAWLVWLFSGTGRGWQITFVFWVAAPYLPALLLAAYLLYAKWLFRPDEPFA